jgi:serine/threonine protein kinase
MAARRAGRARAKHSMSLPSAIGRYEIVRQIGQGGMGKVLLAWDPMLERQVTIKLLNDEQRDDLRQRFTREARSAARYC